MNHSQITWRWPLLVGCAVLFGSQPIIHAQSVGLPTPRLLTTMPMGGQVGTQVEITITGEHLDDSNELTFSDARLTATRSLDPAGQPVPNRYLVTIPVDCPPGLYDAHVMTRLGMSSSRVFCVGTLPEVVQTAGNTSLANAMELPLNTVCNAVMSGRSADFYKFQARQGQRLIVDCASRGIDSKLEAVLVIADAQGRDLIVERRGDVLDFTAPADGQYIAKVHELTYQGGAAFYYRLALKELAAGEMASRHPSTQRVSSFSWPPAGLPEQAALIEIEPNQEPGNIHSITLPADISGAFASAADVDMYEFDAKQGEVWWVEVASERLGRPTDPSVLVQQVTNTGNGEQLTDVVELTDIPNAMKVSSNGYAYDGPPYEAGSPDVIGKFEIKTDGRYRLQITDLFGGTRSDPRNVYRLIIRQAAPDFAVVAWALHMELRNGDRAAFSKPMALRGGASMAFEVAAVRRDGFDGEIELTMEGLPPGVVARGLKIPVGQTRGMMVISAQADAPRGFCNAQFYGHAMVNGQKVTHPCRVASHAWPIPDSWGEIPAPRLMADIPVSVSGVDLAPITIAPAQTTPYEVTVGEKLTIPLVETRRTEFQGAAVSLRPLCNGGLNVPAFDVSLTTDHSELVIEPAALKVVPGDYVIAFHGGAVAKYRHHPEAVKTAEEGKRLAEQAVMTLEAEARLLAETTVNATPESQTVIDKSKADLAEKQKTAAAALAAATEILKQATAASEPRDIVDIVVSEPITIHVKPAESK